MVSTNEDTSTAADSTISKAPDLNGKMILPIKIAAAGLKGHKVAAVYAILDSNYKRGSGEGWEHVKHVSITRDLSQDISYFQSSQKSKSDVAYLRALSFSYPQKATMEDFANSWRAKVYDAGSTLENGIGWGMVPTDIEDTSTATISNEGTNTIITVGDDYEFDDDEDMDEDDLDDYLQMMAESRAAVEAKDAPPPLFVDNTGLSSGIVSLAPNKPEEEKQEQQSDEVISPFDVGQQSVTSLISEDEELDLTPDNVDKVLDEVRPYLISDGGNVSVQNVDVDTGNVYLLLEGACGSCASSTVTMQMGIERVLKEKFGTKLGEVVSVDPEADEEGGGKPTELTIEVVQSEVNRISQAIVAMGGVVRVVNVDPIGEVEIEFRGPNRVKKGLELALLDVEFVKHVNVKFVS